MEDSTSWKLEGKYYVTGKKLNGLSYNKKNILIDSKKGLKMVWTDYNMND